MVLVIDQMLLIDTTVSMGQHLNKFNNYHPPKDEILMSWCLEFVRCIFTHREFIVLVKTYKRSDRYLWGSGCVLELQYYLVKADRMRNRD